MYQEDSLFQAWDFVFLYYVRALLSEIEMKVVKFFVFKEV